MEEQVTVETTTTTKAIIEVIDLDDEDEYSTPAENWKGLMDCMQRNQKKILNTPKKGNKKRKKDIKKSNIKGNTNQPKRQKLNEIDINRLAKVDLTSVSISAATTSSSSSSSSSPASTIISLTEELNEVNVQSKPKDFFPIRSGFAKPTLKKPIPISTLFNNDVENYNGILGWNDSIPTIITLNHTKNLIQQYIQKKQKSCPFYKKIPDTSFCVDAFSYGPIPGIDVYFLSHFHSDHYQGLSKSFGKTLVCESGTGNLVNLKLGVDNNCIRRLELNRVYEIEGVQVVLVNANHCPGSVMFIFRFQNGKTHLHTGDFRYTPSMLRNPFIENIEVDTLYLDTTYCDPKYNFPKQKDTIQQVLEVVIEAVSSNPRTLIVCGAYSIGKERVFFSLAECLGTKVYCAPDKYQMLNVLENTNFSTFLTDSESGASIHVLPMRNIHPKCLSDYLAHRKNLYSNIIGIKPSGWEFSNSTVQGNGFSSKSYCSNTVTIIGIPYSEHSSYSELREFVSRLKPKHVQPTVHIGSEVKRNNIMTRVNSWLRPIFTS